MQKFIRIFSWGMMISFLGTLPLGTLNVTAMQIGVQENILNAIYFSLGCLLVEMIYVRISLVGINWIRKQERLMKIMEWITLFIVLALAAGSFIAATKTTHTKNVLLQNNMHRFLLGVIMSAVNPMQIPFWFGWSTVLFSKKVLQPHSSQYNSYIAGIGIGTFAGNCIFIFGGQWIVQRIANSQQYVNWIIGAVFSITAIIQLVKILRHKDAVYQFTHEQQPVNKENII